MPDYQLGKIYKISNDIDDEEYYGSSTYPYLTERMRCHHNCCKDITGRRDSILYKKMREIGFEHFKIELVERYPCNSKEELNIKEQYYLDLHKPKLNDFNAIGQSEEYYKERKREKYLENRDEVLKINKERYEKNKVEILKKQKEYTEKNHDKINAKITCSCGCIISKKSLKRHLQRIAHIE